MSKAKNTKDLPSGWAMTDVSRRAHYFQKGSVLSLCCKVGFYFGPRFDSDHDNEDNCAKCKKARESLLRTAAKPDSDLFS